ncbi:alpha/beta fold hydrolase [Marinicella sp. W31]|uniref:alpha/beta fold hydrolase n=1 Tax=Marinicella sp. W31 TaxID=3023713 RepID=UPI00375824FF
MRNLICFCIAMMFLSVTVSAAESLKRRASWEATFEPIQADKPGRTIKTLEPGSPLYKQGFRTGDHIIQINNEVMVSNAAWTDFSDDLTEKRDYDILARRGQNLLRESVRFKGVSREQHAGIKTIYTSIVNDYGIRQRLIITHPQNAEGRLPGIIVLQGLSCSTVELLPNDTANYKKVFKALITQTDMAVLRIEKPGLGDSEGHCSQTDFRTELNGYQRAIEYFLEQPYVNKAQVIVYGNSMGSALAPYMANTYGLAGIISDGTFYRSWFEHMLEIERRIRRIQGDDEATISQKINQAYIPMYYEMLVRKKSYDDIVTDNPLLAEFNYHAPEHMYGRPMAYYHQLQDFDFAAAWSNVKVPVRIRWGRLDWIMSESDNDMIIETLKRAGHQDHVLYKYPQLDHWHTLHESEENSFFGRPGQWDKRIAEQVVEWAKELVTKAGQN